jgi:hypothetical protein
MDLESGNYSYNLIFEIDSILWLVKESISSLYKNIYEQTNKTNQ